LNLLIEYQGKQHYELVNFRNKMSDDKVYKNFEVIKIRDHLKKEYCKNNNIPLLEIHYKDFKNIESILDSVFINTYKV
jgi:hypothetical protein